MLIVRISFTAPSHHAVGDTARLNDFLGFEILLKKDDIVYSIKSKGLKVDSTHFVHGDMGLYSRWHKLNGFLGFEILL